MLAQMGVGLGFFFSILFLFSNPTCSQQPNTDEFFVSDFLKKMGITDESSSQDYNLSAPVCSWEGVFCDAKRVSVIAFVASGFGLSGVIPENTIGKLSRLQSLDLSNNRITSLSSDFWSLGKNLNTLNLSSNHISGILPNNIANFAGLETLDLSFNAFSGDIPTSLGSLLSLQVLKLGQNSFAGSFPSGILNCQSLVSLDVSSNLLNGTLPAAFSASFPKLKALNLAGNDFHGRSSFFSEMKSITYLNLSQNSFHGSVIAMFQKRLQVADLSRNYFQGHLSDVYSNPNFNWSRLVVLDVSSNQLSGEFFGDLNDAQSLKYLSLADNRFSGQVFPRVEKLTGLEYLNLSATGLTGGIPSHVTQLSSLSTLDLSKNHLTGRVPNLHVNNLEVLDLSSNNLTGEIPELLLVKLHQMERFSFSYNNLTLCDSTLSPKVLKTAFIGCIDSCPFAANPDHGRKAARSLGLKLSLAISLSTVCLLVGLLCLAFGCKRGNTTAATWETKQEPWSSSKDEQTISGPFSFQTDSTTWVADVKVATAVPVVIFEKPLLNITFADLLSATSHFDRGTLLAQGRFGPVYRGFLPGGVHVAVKVLVHVSTMTDDEVARELEHLGRIRHPNLVPLTGYCLAGDQRIAIYDYMENGNLQNLLHDLPLGIPRPDDWSTDTWDDDDDDGIQCEDAVTNWRFRHKIALGTARALAFLHHGCSPSIIHRDVKASSIYLDSNLEPRLSDFGLVNGVEDDIPHWSPGYVPPEFCEPETGPPTLKSDVYGFGVVLFELITGKKPIGDNYSDGDKESTLVSWIRGVVRKNECAMAIDHKIRATGSETEMEEALRIGYLCTADLPTKRPSMHQIVGLLKDIEPIVVSSSPSVNE